MQNFSDIQEKVFQDCKIILAELQSAPDAEQFLAIQHKFEELQELLSFLKISQKYGDALPMIEPLQVVEKQDENSQDDYNGIDDKYIAEEEVIFNNELNQIDESEIAHPEINNETDEELEEEVIFNNELNQIDDTENTVSAEEESPVDEFSDDNAILENEVTAENIIEETEVSQAEIENEEFEAVEELVEAKKAEDEAEIHENDLNEALKIDAEINENRGKIVEFEKEPSAESAEPVFETKSTAEDKHNFAHKLKLANIKGLKKVESLFDDDPLQEESAHEENAGSLLKSNVPTDYMEADKKHVFKLDLNDKLAFSKMLFGGSQSDLNETVNTLNSFSSLDDAKEYLSDLYYQKNWKKVDEYAQRLWDLVENKFQ